MTGATDGKGNDGKGNDERDLLGSSKRPCPDPLA
ncbi:hypothetical protein Pla52o_29870 [Novipirellula galeiformis]|uniref:Uncharacterized protein n=1 Tax=Novipirellula galeiformis TaxID=2528004 RepID=A0A5C6CJC7_9BACT|nr:hypothetical protein Pla52o_29870 [Novipirellula galeiformis]